MKRTRTHYVITSLFPLVYALLDQFRNQLQASYSQNLEFPVLVFALDAVSPVVCSILLLAKGAFWTKADQSVRRAVDLLVTLLMAAVILLFYNHFGLLYLISNHREISLLMCIQLCFLAYDFIR